MPSPKGKYIKYQFPSTESGSHIINIGKWARNHSPLRFYVVKEVGDIAYHTLGFDEEKSIANLTTLIQNSNPESPPLPKGEIVNEKDLPKLLEKAFIVVGHVKISHQWAEPPEQPLNETKFRINLNLHDFDNLVVVPMPKPDAEKQPKLYHQWKNGLNSYAIRSFKISFPAHVEHRFDEFRLPNHIYPYITGVSIKDGNFSMFINNNFRGDSVNGFLDLSMKPDDEIKDPVISQAVMIQMLSGEDRAAAMTRSSKMKSIVKSSADTSIQINGLETNRVDKISFNGISQTTEMTLHCLDVFIIDTTNPEKFGLHVHEIVSVYNQ